ncbi:MAG: alpha/beta hydrolase [Candidatus Aminicenantes bacterium]|nr:alpha/beta hydrolase [Candidatus Aminicenantes bacterium]
MDAFLSYDWVGVLIALVLLLIGLGIFFLGLRQKRKGAKWSVLIFGCLIIVISLILLGGSGYHVFQVLKAGQKFPRPGELYEVDGFKMHIMVEGENAETEEGRTPTIIFIPGGYSQGLGLWHLHKAMAKEIRSILFDRAGTGWSQRSPYPRHVKRDTQELKMLLDAAGEKGPFILVGHSWGGFFANNYALNFHDDVAGLVLFEATPPEAIVGPGSRGLKMFADYLKLSAVLGLFSLNRFLPSLGGEGAMDPDSPDFLYKPLLEVWEMASANELKVRGGWAAAASFEAMLRNPELQVQSEYALGDIPMFAIYRENMNSDVEDLPEAERQKMKEQSMKMFKVTEQEYEEMMQSVNESVKEVPKLSKRGELMSPPEGATHQFPYEFPEFCLEKIREMIALVQEDSE